MPFFVVASTLFRLKQWLLHILRSPYCTADSKSVGWFAAEMGKTPWIVYGHLRTG